MTRKKQHCPKKAHGIVKLGSNISSSSKCFSTPLKHSNDHPLSNKDRLLKQESKCEKIVKTYSPYTVLTTTHGISTSSSPCPPSLHYTYKQIWQDNFDEGRRDAKSTGSEESEGSLCPLAFYKEAPFLNGLLDQKVSTPSPTLVIHHRYQDNSDDDKLNLIATASNSSPDYTLNYHIGPGSSYAFKVDKTETLWKERFDLNVEEEKGANSDCYDSVKTDNTMVISVEKNSSPISVAKVNPSIPISVTTELPLTSSSVASKSCQLTSSKRIAAQVKAKKILASALIKHSTPNITLEMKGSKDKNRVKVDDTKSCKVKRRTSTRFAHNFSLGYNNMSNSKCILTTTMTQSLPTHKLDGSHWYGPHYPPAVSIHDYHKFYNYLSAKAFKEMILGHGLKESASSSKLKKSSPLHRLPYGSIPITEYENQLNFFKPFTSYFDYSAWPSPYPFRPTVNDQINEGGNNVGKLFLPNRNHHPNAQLPFMPSFFFPPYPYYYDAPHTHCYNDAKASPKCASSQREKTGSPSNLSSLKNRWANHTTSTPPTHLQTEGVIGPTGSPNKIPCCNAESIPKSSTLDDKLCHSSFSTKNSVTLEDVLSTKTHSPYYTKDVVPSQYLSPGSNSLNNFPPVIPPYDPFNQLPFSIYPRLQESINPFPFTYPWQYGPPWHAITTRDLSLADNITDVQKSLNSSTSVCMARSVDACPSITQTSKKQPTHALNALHLSNIHTVANNNTNAPNPKMVRGQNTWLARGSKKAKDIMKCIWCGESFASLPDLTSHMVATQHYRKIIPIIAAHNHTVGEEGHNVSSPKSQNAMPSSSVRSPHQSSNKRTLPTLPSDFVDVRSGINKHNFSRIMDPPSSHIDNTFSMDNKPNDDQKCPYFVPPPLRFNVMESNSGQHCECSEGEFRKDEGKKLSSHKKHSEKKEEKGWLNTITPKVSNDCASIFPPTVSGLDNLLTDKANASFKTKSTKLLKKKFSTINGRNTIHNKSKWQNVIERERSPYNLCNGFENINRSTNQNIYKSVLDSLNTPHQSLTTPYMLLFPHLLQSFKTNLLEKSPDLETKEDSPTNFSMLDKINHEYKDLEKPQVNNDETRVVNVSNPLESLDVDKNGVSLLKKQLLSQFIYHDICPKVKSPVHPLPNGCNRMDPCQEPHIAALKTLINDTFDTYLMQNFKEIKNLARISNSTPNSNWDADSSESENGRRSSLCVVSC